MEIYLAMIHTMEMATIGVFSDADKAVDAIMNFEGVGDGVVVKAELDKPMIQSWNDVKKGETNDEIVRRITAGKVKNTE